MSTNSSFLIFIEYRIAAIRAGIVETGCRRAEKFGTFFISGAIKTQQALRVEFVGTICSSHDPLVKCHIIVIRTSYGDIKLVVSIVRVLAV